MEQMVILMEYLILMEFVQNFGLMNGVVESRSVRLEDVNQITGFDMKSLDIDISERNNSNNEINRKVTLYFSIDSEEKLWLNNFLGEEEILFGGNGVDRDIFVFDSKTRTFDLRSPSTAVKSDNIKDNQNFIASYKTSRFIYNLYNFELNNSFASEEIRKQGTDSLISKVLYCDKKDEYFLANEMMGNRLSYNIASVSEGACGGISSLVSMDRKYKNSKGVRAVILVDPSCQLIKLNEYDK